MGIQIRCKKKHLSIYSHDLDKIERKEHGKRRRKKRNFYATLWCRQWTHEHSMLSHKYVYSKQRDGTIYSICATRVDQLPFGNSMLSRCFRLLWEEIFCFFFVCKVKERKKKVLQFMFDWLHCCNQSLNSAVFEKFFSSGGIFFRVSFFYNQKRGENFSNDEVHAVGVN